MSVSDKAFLCGGAAMVAAFTVAGISVLVNDVIKNGDKPAAQAFGPHGTDVIVDKGRIYVVKPTVPRF